MASHQSGKISNCLAITVNTGMVQFFSHTPSLNVPHPKRGYDYRVASLRLEV
jgi:hypothetical protein